MSVDGQVVSSSELGQIVSRSFPVGKLDYAFGYGSGVFAQYEQKEKPMIDFILTTNDSRGFHLENIARNSRHYSLMATALGVDFICRLQEIGPGLYFHPYAQVLLNPSPPQVYTVKYGVISLSKLKQDLISWSWLYAAGRMQKPVATVNLPHSNACDEILEYQQLYNLRYALATALLLLVPSSDYNDPGNLFRQSQVYEHVVGLSYSGDPRMVAGAEDPQKIHKLVYSPGNIIRLDDLYSYQWLQLEKIGLVGRLDKGMIEVDLLNPRWRHEVWQRLPPNIKFNTQSAFDLSDRKFKTTVERDVILQAYDSLRSSLSKIVAPAARLQSIKGIISAGIFNSLRYAGTKLSKGLLR